VKQVGTYTKKGREVTLDFNVQISAKDVAMAGGIRIAGVPFTSTSNADWRSAGSLGMMAGVTLPANFVNCTLSFPPSVTTIYLHRHGSGQATAAVAVAEIVDATTLRGSITYIV
jgi:hypothetical protein